MNQDISLASLILAQQLNGGELGCVQLGNNTHAVFGFLLCIKTCIPEWLCFRCQEWGTAL